MYLHPQPSLRTLWLQHQCLRAVQLVLRTTEAQGQKSAQRESSSHRDSKTMGGFERGDNDCLLQNNVCRVCSLFHRSHLVRLQSKQPADKLQQRRPLSQSFDSRCLYQQLDEHSVCIWVRAKSVIVRLCERLSVCKNKHTNSKKIWIKKTSSSPRFQEHTNTKHSSNPLETKRRAAELQRKSLEKMLEARVCGGEKDRHLSGAIGCVLWLCMGY